MASLDVKTVILLAILARGSLWIPAAAQDKPFTVSVDTRLVVQTVRVTSRDGHPLEGLTRENFELTEDGVPQTISVFEFEKLDDTPRGQQAPTVPALREKESFADRRLLALYFDMGFMSAVDRLRALSSAQEFIEKQMTAADLVAIITYSGGAVRIRRDFTDDVAALQETLTFLLNGEDEDDLGTDFGQNTGEFNLFNTDRQLAALQTAVNMLSIHKQHKSLVYFASGMRLGGVDNQAQLRATLNAARRANVAFYPVDSRGLTALPTSGDASRPSSGGAGLYTGATAMAALRGFQRSQDALFTLAADTGGKALLDYNDLSLGIVQAQRGLSSYYVLGYYPTNTAPDGKVRRVKISLKNASADLAYRESYYGDKDFSRFTAADKERQLEEALMLGDPITDITIALEVNYFQMNQAEYFVPLTLKIPGNELVLAQKEGAERTVIDFIGEIKNEYGTTMRNIRDKVEISLRGETASLLASSPIQYDAGVTLLPGNYVVKVLARNAETGRIGTYQTAFVVPNLNNEDVRLPTSSVVLSSQRVLMADALFNTGRDRDARAQAANPLVEDGQKLIPSVTRVFSKSRTMLVYLQAYQRDSAVARPMTAIVSFLQESRKAAEISFSVTGALDARSKAVPVRLSVPLGELAEGDYVCQVTVLDHQAGKVAFWYAPVRIVP
jgi:VWFA-related protein